MFTVVKVREGLAAGDYRDPGWYKHPPGTVAYEVDAGMAGDALRQKDAPAGLGAESRSPMTCLGWI